MDKISSANSSFISRTNFKPANGVSDKMTQANPQSIQSFDSVQIDGNKSKPEEASQNNSYPAPVETANESADGSDTGINVDLPGKDSFVAASPEEKSDTSTATGETNLYMSNPNGTLTIGMSDESLSQGLNLVRIPEANQLGVIADSFFGDRDLRIATAGFSSPPPGYEELTSEFLTSTLSLLGTDRAGLASSPTLDKGSIDAISTEVGNKLGVPVFYLTAEDYVSYIKPENLSSDIDKKTFCEADKFVLPTGDEYSKGTAEVSNRMLVTGGRTASVSDFVNAVNHGNKAVVLDNLTLEGDTWDSRKNRPDNASRYIRDQIDAFNNGEPLPHPEIGGLTTDFLKQHDFDKLVKIVEIHSKDDIPEAALKTASHFKE